MTAKAALYGQLAPYYDRIYHWKDYKQEAEKLKGLIQMYKASRGKALLDVACGTGKHLGYFKDDYDCIGVDGSREMLAVARKNVPQVRFVQGDMTGFKLKERFDVVLCLFSSTGYLLTRAAVAEAAANFARHLKDGGVLIIEPWLRKSMWQDKTAHIQTYDGEGVKIARLSFVKAKGPLSLLDEQYLIAEKGKGIKYIKDFHRMRFFEIEPTLKALRRAGLYPQFTEDSLMKNRGLVIATKPIG